MTDYTFFINIFMIRKFLPTDKLLAVAGGQKIDAKYCWLNFKFAPQFWNAEMWDNSLS